MTTRAGSPSRGIWFDVLGRDIGGQYHAPGRRGRVVPAAGLASSRSEARAASVSAAYSSSSVSPMAYASRSAGVTAKPGSGPGPTWPASKAWATAGRVDGKKTRMVSQSLPQSRRLFRPVLWVPARSPRW